MKIFNILQFKKNIIFTFCSFLLVMLLCGFAGAAVIFSENYDGNEWDVVKNCSDGNPSSGRWDWTDSGPSCISATYQNITHYSGEVSTPGRGGTGKSLKLWRHTGSDFLDYSGYLNSYIPLGTYRDIYQRFYLKWPYGLTVPTGVGTKFNRMYIGTASSPRTGEVSILSEGELGDNGYFMIYMPGMGSNYTTFRTQTFSELGVNDGDWHSIEVHYKINSPGQSDGEFEMWIDGYMIPIKYYVGTVQLWSPLETENPPTHVYGKDAGLGIYDISGVPSDYYVSKPLDPGIGNTGSSNSPYVATPDEWLAFEFDDYVVSTTYIGPTANNRDNEEPTIPISFQAVKVTSSQVSLRWDASTDNVGVMGYNIYRDGSKIGASSTTTYTDNSVVSNTTYSYAVAAYDAVGNESNLSDDLQVTIPASSYSSIIFETWKDNNINNWDDDLIVGDTHIDTNPVYVGNYSIKMESSNPGNYAHFFGDHPGVDGEMVTDISIEEHYYLSPGFQFASIGMKLWVVNSFESWGAGYNLAEGQSKPHTWAPYYMSISVYSNGQLYGNLTRSDGLGGTGDLWHNYQQNVGSPVALNPGSWNKIKFRLKLNSLGNSDGIFQLWVNDELKCSYSNMNYRGTYSSYGWNHLMMSMDANPSHPQSQWISRDKIHIFSGVGFVLSPPGSFQGSSE